MSKQKKIESNQANIDQAVENWEVFIVGSKITGAAIIVILGLMALFIV